MAFSYVARAYFVISLGGGLQHRHVLLPVRAYAKDVAGARVDNIRAGNRTQKQGRLWF